MSNQLQQFEFVQFLQEFPQYTSRLCCADENATVIYCAANTITTITAESLKQKKLLFFLETDAQLIYFLLLTTSDFINITIKLIGSGAAAQFYCIYLLADQSQAQLITRQEHYASHTTSKIILKGLVTDMAQINHEGLIFIDKPAANAVAWQHNKNLLLSSQAKSWAKPSLEVLNHDVQCAHGSASGQLDQEQLWYMQARGIDPGKAKSLLLRGFFTDILEKIPDQKLGDSINQVINEYVK